MVLGCGTGPVVALCYSSAPKLDSNVGSNFTYAALIKVGHSLGNFLACRGRGD